MFYKIFDRDRRWPRGDGVAWDDGRDSSLAFFAFEPLLLRIYDAPARYCSHFSGLTERAL